MGSDRWNNVYGDGPTVRFHCDKCGQDYGIGEKCRCPSIPTALGSLIANEKVVEVDYRRNKRILDLEIMIERLTNELAETNKSSNEFRFKSGSLENLIDKIAKALMEKKGMTIEELLKADEKVENPTRFQLLEVDDD